MLSVHNGKVDGWLNGYYVGRSGKGKKSVLGNPYEIGVHGTRDEVIELFRGWLWRKVQARDPVVMAELQRLKAQVLAGEPVRLLCFCELPNCHGRVIKRCVEWLIAQDS